DVLAMPSRTDSFGIVFLEAWFYGKPVIGARAGGVPEVIDDGRDGFLVNFGDTDMLARRIAQLLDDRVLAQEFGAAGREKVLQNWTWDKIYPQIETLYHQVSGKS
ncbi:MAG TPA: glycosyltransferase family 4 protein, partial [Anaerolineae bacterium]